MDVESKPNPKKSEKCNIPRKMLSHDPAFGY
jgi:hypothetical protein